MPAKVEVTRGGLRFELDPREEIQRQIYFGAFEERDLRTALASVRRGGTVVDVGANVGYYTLVLARHVGQGGHVHAFEPDPALADHLSRHVALNGLGDRVTVHRMAVGAEEGTADFLRPEGGNRGAGTLVHYEDLSGESFEVEVTTLDGVARRHGLDVIDFLKLDVEGGEVDALRGAGGLLGRQAIRHVLVELNGWRLDDRGLGLDDLVGPLGRQGYELDGLNGEFLADLGAGRRTLRSLVVNLLLHAPAAARGD
jgi:FkbM family methyltransferase